MKNGRKPRLDWLDLRSAVRRFSGPSLYSFHAYSMTTGRAHDVPVVKLLCLYVIT